MGGGLSLFVKRDSGAKMEIMRASLGVRCASLPVDTRVWEVGARF